MKYDYEDLSPEQFETLIVILGQRLFGISLQGFATGQDGGRDARFVGTANLFPSKAAPWIGTTIVQAKHTNGYNASFSETDFFSPPSSNNVIGEETPRIKRLRESGDLDNYIMFANRRLTAGTNNLILRHISSMCEIPIGSIYLCGVEQLDRWMKEFEEVPRLADLDPVDSPLLVSPDELAEVIEAFARHKQMVGSVLGDPPTARTPYEEKNKLNNLTQEYAREQRQRFLKETFQIQTFLSAPENAELLAYYESVVEEFQLQIIAKRRDYQTFDAVMEHLVKLLFARDPVLRQRRHKRLTRTMLFYMYWNCDIGKTSDATAN